MSDRNGGTAGSTAKNSVQADVGRQGKIVVICGAVLIIAVAYIGYGYWGDHQTAPSQVSRLQSTNITARTQESPQYRKTLETYNKREASAATENGTSFISVLSTAPQPTPKPQATQSIPASFEAAPASPASTRVPATPQPISQAQAQMVQKQLLALLDAWTPVAGTAARASEDGIGYMASFTSRQVALPVGRTPEAQPNALPQVVVDPYAIVPAVLETAIDTDENSLVSAKIPTGQFAGAEVFATGYTRLNETVDMTFTAMVWNGRSYKISAKPVDLQTGRTALSGDVNSRWFERIILPAVAKGIASTGQLFAQANSQTVVTPQGGAVQSFQTPDGATIAGGFVSGMGVQAGNVLANDAAQIPQKQVLIAPNTTIGIRFIGPVLSSDDATGGAVPQSRGGSTQGALQTSVPNELDVLRRPASGPPPQLVQPTAPPAFPTAQPFNTLPAYQPVR